MFAMLSEGDLSWPGSSGGSALQAQWSRAIDSGRHKLVYKCMFNHVQTQYIPCDGSVTLQKEATSG